MPLLTISHISRTEGDFVLTDISFTQKKHEKISIAGETGSGKSTLLKIIAGLQQPDSGDVYLNKERVEGAHERLVPGHPKIAYLSQNFELPKFLRVEQVLSYANTLTEETAATLYSVCQIDHLQKRRTDELSGGEKQRIAMARLLITSPELLLLDEPFSHLDMVHKNTLKAVIQEISSRLKITCILVSHDPMDTLSWSDKIIVMKDGKVVQKGEPSLIYSQPVSEYVAGLFGKYNILGQQTAKSVFKLKPAGSKVIVRPEAFRLVKKDVKGVAGKIVNVSFFGSFHEVDVDVNGVVIRVRSEGKTLAAGKRVNVALDKKSVAWIESE
jgi:ABC-type Fe3+/spermidine/putrescine transport system ATPase subunit